MCAILRRAGRDEIAARHRPHPRSRRENSPCTPTGRGEIGITGVGAAVANAVYNATGKRVRLLPISLDKLL